MPEQPPPQQTGPSPLPTPLLIEAVAQSLRHEGYGHIDAEKVVRRFNDQLPDPMPTDLVPLWMAQAFDVPGEALVKPPPEPAAAVWNAIDLYRATMDAPHGLFAQKALCRQSVSLLLGEGGTGKTWIAMAIARCAALSEDLGHIAVTPGRVLFLSEEMTEAEMRGRLHEIFNERELEDIGDRLRFRCRAGIKADTYEGLAELRKLIEGEGKPEYVFIDALVDIHSKNENSNSEMGPVFRGLRDDVATPNNCSITVLHHAGKPGEFLSGSNRSRGASVIRDICADVILVEGKADSPSRDIRFSKCRHGGGKPPQPFTIEMVPVQGTSLVTFAVGEAGGLDFAKGGIAVKAVQQAGGRMMRQELLAALRKQHGWSERTAAQAVMDALGSGLLQKGEKIGKEVPIETVS